MNKQIWASGLAVLFLGACTTTHHHYHDRDRDYYAQDRAEVVSDYDDRGDSQYLSDGSYYYADNEEVDYGDYYVSPPSVRYYRSYYTEIHDPYFWGASGYYRGCRSWMRHCNYWNPHASSVFINYHYRPSYYGTWITIGFGHGFSHGYGYGPGYGYGRYYGRSPYWSHQYPYGRYDYAGYGRDSQNYYSGHHYGTILRPPQRQDAQPMPKPNLRPTQGSQVNRPVNRSSAQPINRGEYGDTPVQVRSANQRFAEPQASTRAEPMAKPSLSGTRRTAPVDAPARDDDSGMRYRPPSMSPAPSRAGEVSRSVRLPTGNRGEPSVPMQIPPREDDNSRYIDEMRSREVISRPKPNYQPAREYSAPPREYSTPQPREYSAPPPRVISTPTRSEYRPVRTPEPVQRQPVEQRYEPRPALPQHKPAVQRSAPPPRPVNRGERSGDEIEE